MKIVCEVDIALPRERVIALFDDPANMKKWQPDLLRFEPVSGTPGQPGAVSRLVYKAGKGEFDMLETITTRNLPDEFSGTYDNKMGRTAIRNLFTDRGASTRWVAEAEFAPKGFMKVLSPFVGAMMRKQTQAMLERFKAFAESAQRS